MSSIKKFYNNPKGWIFTSLLVFLLALGIFVASFIIRVLEYRYLKKVFAPVTPINQPSIRGGFLGDSWVNDWYKSNAKGFSVTLCGSHNNQGSRILKKYSKRIIGVSLWEQPSESDLDLINSFINLRKIYWSEKSNSIANQIIESIQPHTLHAFQWHNGVYTLETIELLAQRQACLKKLILTNDIEGILEPQTLSYFSSLEQLTLRGFSIGKPHLDRIRDISDLKVLHLESIPTAELDIFLSENSFPKLTHFYMNQINETQMEALASFAPNLEQFITERELSKKEKQKLKRLIPSLVSFLH